MKKIWLSCRKYISLTLFIATMLIMLFPIDSIEILNHNKEKIILTYSYYDIMPFQKGIVLPFMCMIFTAITGVLIVLALIKVVHAIAPFISSISSFTLSFLFLILDEASKISIVVMILEFAVVVFTFPLMMWITDKDFKGGINNNEQNI